jgi:hypothetical protein
MGVAIVSRRLSFRGGEGGIDLLLGLDVLVEAAHGVDLSHVSKSSDLWWSY